MVETNRRQSVSIRSVYRLKDEEDFGQDNEHEYLIPDGCRTEASYGSSPSAEPQDNGSKIMKRQSKFMTWAAFDADLSLWECLYLTLILLAIGVTVFSLLVEKWSFIESLYFTLVLLTTVGYGDMAPTTPEGKMFTAIFALCGVFVIGLALGVVGSELVDAEIDVLIEKASTGESSPKRPSSLFDSSRKVGQICWIVIRILSPIFVGAFIIAYLEGWPWYDALYYTVITATTVGLGDLSPTSERSEACAILFIPLAVAAMAHILDEGSTLVMKRRREKHSQKLGRSVKMTEEDLDVLDTSQDGQVSRLEYVEFMLKAMDIVDEDLFAELHSQFNKLDATKDGFLTKRDLELNVDEHVRELSNFSSTAAEQL